MARSLRDYLESVLLERDCSHTHAESLRSRVDAYGRHLGRLATLDDLEPDTLNGWVVAMQRSGQYKPRTVVHYRDAILLVWRVAFDRGDTPTPPWRIRKVRVPQQTVHAWRPAEVRQLVNSVGCLRGRVPGTAIRKRDWYAAYLYTGYATGFRRCDLMQWSKWEDISEDVLTICQRKTGYVISRRLTRQSLDSLHLLEHDTGYILPWPGRLQSFYESFNAIVRNAGVRPGTPKWLRRTSGSVVEGQAPGTGGQFLGHRDPSMFDKSYHDRSISRQVPEPPPEL